ncbi:uncharacterized protein LOC131605978 [Vicia villosa]|uniref:uncharacterized protein LOC131605978 n=1 Tax=Vicia villosa TaxID=3911 RepID=UPI00273B5CB5|nr:uncharacterized protein LOC131605978 [Vicia villosa]
MVLQGLNNNLNFNFHPKCEKLKIINVCFAYDILLFARGRTKSIKLVMKKMKYFSATTGLQKSIPKSKLYLGGLDVETTRLIQQATDFDIGNMLFQIFGGPFKQRETIYIQLPTSNREDDEKTEPLEHETFTIWKETTIIEKCLFFISNYWMHIFPLPKKVIAHSEGLCRNFLWTGKDSYIRKAPIAWEHVCDLVAAGGLNLISLTAWNKATIGKMLWNIAKIKDRLWIHWIHEYYMNK